MNEFNTGFVIFPDLTQLDFTGPYEVLSRLGTPASLSTPSRFPAVQTHIIAKTMAPVRSDRVWLRFRPVDNEETARTDRFYGKR